MVRVGAFAVALAAHTGVSVSQATGFAEVRFSADSADAKPRSFTRLAGYASSRLNAVGLPSAQCDALIKAGLGDSLLLPSGPNGDYSQALSGFWTFHSQNVSPWCILQAKNTDEVSKAIKALSSMPNGTGHSGIGVKGGGHSHWNNNNVAQGVTIDLSLMDKTTVRNATCKNDKFTHIASVGPGSTWAGVLQVTEQYGLAVAGGRVGSVGVSGLTLGGGVSFYSGYRGFTCDNIINFEVVLADGSIVNANKRENKKLWKALRGGGSNFGIVTRFDIAAFPTGPLYGGIVKSEWQYRNIYTQSYVDMMHSSNKADSQILMWQHEAGWSEPTVGSIPINVDNDKNSTIFSSLDKAPRVSEFLGEFSYGQLISSDSAPNGKRNVWYSMCFRAVTEMFEKSEELLFKLIRELNSLAYADETMDTMFSFQPMPVSWGKVNPGGNVLGVDDSLKEASTLFLAQAAVSSKEMEIFFQTRLAAVIAELEAYAESIGANTAFRYLNYVHPSQKPLQSYGAKNVAFMKEVAAEYDPSGFFQTRISGGFKISHVP